MLPWSGNDTSITDEFIDRTVKVLKNFIHETYDRDTKVIEFRSQEDILKEFDFDLTENSSDLETLINVTKKILDFSVKTGRIISFKFVEKF